MTFLLNKLHNFVEKEANVYGINIEHEIITDTLVMSQRANFQHYPTTGEIYSMLDQLKTYVLANNVNIANAPMLNVTVTKEGYATMVAIPINKPMPNKGKMLLKRIVPGTPSLVSQVKGGNYSIINAFAQLENYRQDYQKSTPAIPYQILLTDRSKEADTSKWVTKCLLSIISFLRACYLVDPLPG